MDYDILCAGPDILKPTIPKSRQRWHPCISLTGIELLKTERGHQAQMITGFGSNDIKIKKMTFQWVRDSANENEGQGHIPLMKLNVNVHRIITTGHFYFDRTIHLSSLRKIGHCPPAYIPPCKRLTWSWNPVPWYPIKVIPCQYTVLNNKFIWHIRQLIKAACICPKISECHTTVSNWCCPKTGVRTFTTTWPNDINLSRKATWPDLDLCARHHVLGQRENNFCHKKSYT